MESFSELTLRVIPSTVPHYLNFASLVPGGTITTNNGIPGYNSATANYTVTATNTIKLSSLDGINWQLSASGSGVAKSYTPSTRVGAPGDTAGMIAYDSAYLYICTANYDGSSSIWKRVVTSTF